MTEKITLPTGDVILGPSKVVNQRRLANTVRGRLSGGPAVLRRRVRELTNVLGGEVRREDGRSVFDLQTIHLGRGKQVAIGGKQFDVAPSKANELQGLLADRSVFSNEQALRVQSLKEILNAIPASARAGTTKPTSASLDGLGLDPTTIALLAAIAIAAYVLLS